jgi:gluconate 5-dehydrogenase
LQEVLKLTEVRNPYDQFNVEGFGIGVTGASGFLGKAMVKQLVGNGAVVCIIGRNLDSLKALESECVGLKGKVLIQSGSIGSLSTIDSAIEQILDSTGHLSGWVNNAYEPIPISGPIDATAEELNHYMEALTSTIQATQYVAKVMIKNPPIRALEKSIVNIASMYGHVAPRLDIYEQNPHLQNPPGYGVVKAGMIQHTKYCAVNLGKFGIRVNSISPGPFPGPKAQSITSFIDNLQRQSPLNRIGKPEELAGVVQFLLSSASSYITGSDIAVDGGWRTW